MKRYPQGLSSHSTSLGSFASRQSITPAKIGRAMKKLGYEKIANTNRYGYIVVFVDAEMRQTNKRSTAREIYLESHPQDDDE